MDTSFLQTSPVQFQDAAPAQAASHGGFLSRMASSIEQPFKTFGKALFNAPAAINREIHNKPITDIQQHTFGTTDSGQIAKDIIGSTAQLGGMAVMPAGEGSLARIIAGARGGGLIGAGSSLQNNQDILKGTVGGAIGGGATAGLLPIAAKGIAGGSRAALTGKVGSDVTGVSSEATPTLGNKIGNALVKKGEEEKANLGGFAVGQRVGGTKLGTAASQRIQQTLNEQGITGLTAKEGQAQIEQKLSSLGQAREGLFNAHNSPLVAADKTTLSKAVADNLGREAGGTTPTVQQSAATFLKEAINQKDLQGLAKYRTSLDNNIKNWNRNPASAEPGNQVAADAVRGAITNMLHEKVPGLQAVDSPYHDLSQANEALKNAAGRTANLSTAGTGFWSRILGGETAEKIKGATAAGVTKAGKLAGGVSESAQAKAPSMEQSLIQNEANKQSSILSRLGVPAQAAARLGVAGAAANPNQPAPNGSDQIKNLIGPNTSQPPAAPASLYPEQNMLYDIERDPKSASTYEALYKLLNNDSTTTQQKTQNTAAQNVLSSLPILAQTLQQAGGARSGIVGGIENLATKAHLIQGPTAASIADITTQRNLLAAEIAKAVTGSTVRSPEIINMYAEQLPSVSDTPAEAQKKIESLTGYINQIISNTQGNSSSSSGSDILSQLGG